MPTTALALPVSHCADYTNPVAYLPFGIFLLIALAVLGTSAIRNQRGERRARRYRAERASARAARPLPGQHR